MESRQAEEVEEVGLVVKSPAQRHPDLLLSARRSWSVRRLKAELRHLHPDEPPEDTQRLIYSGKLLPDHLFLQEVLTKEAVHALHLVCNSKNLPTMSGTDMKVAEAKQQSTALGQNPSDLPGLAPSQEQVAAGPPVTTEQAGMSSPVTPPPFQAMSSSYSSYTTYHMLQLWFHQLYTRQYYMQYMAANAHSGDLSSARSSQEISVAPVTPPAPLPGPFPAENAPVEQNAPPQANPGVNQNLRMNAQGGPLMEGDEEVNRDWLDWLYSATLFYVFVNIVYFYSSMSRFLLVMAGTFLMYLHQVGWFPFRRRAAHPPPPLDNVPVQAAVNQDQNNNLQQEENPREQNEPENSEAIGENQPAPAVSFMSTAWLFFKTFFASLLPEGLQLWQTNWAHKLPLSSPDTSLNVPTNGQGRRVGSKRANVDLEAKDRCGWTCNEMLAQSFKEENRRSPKPPWLESGAKFCTSSVWGQVQERQIPTDRIT